MRTMLAWTLSVLLPPAALAQETVVTGSKIRVDDCSKIVRHPPGRLERIEGVYMSFVDWTGFVHCTTAADCRDYIKKDTSEFTPTAKAQEQLLDRGAAPWGVYKLVFMGRRGKMTIPDLCYDQGLPTAAEYVTVEKVISARPLARHAR